MGDDFDDNVFGERTLTTTGTVSSSAPSGELEAYLVVLSGSRVGEMIRVGAGLIIGRGKDAGLRVDDPGVSKRHARLSQGRDGRMVVGRIG